MNDLAEDWMAESEGFEPPSPCGLTVFKTAAFDRSANSPGGIVAVGRGAGFAQQATALAGQGAGRLAPLEALLPVEEPLFRMLPKVSRCGVLTTPLPGSGVPNVLLDPGGAPMPVVFGVVPVLGVVGGALFAAAGGAPMTPGDAPVVPLVPVWPKPRVESARSAAALASLKGMDIVSLQSKQMRHRRKGHAVPANCHGARSLKTLPNGPICRS
jgi:hypothetical protein